MYQGEYGRPVGPAACGATLSGIASLTAFTWIAPLLERGWAGALGECSAIPFIPEPDRPQTLAADFESTYAACKVRTE